MEPPKVGDSNVIEKMQRCASKFFLLHDYADSYEGRLHRIGLLPLQTVRKIKDLLYLHKLMHHCGGNINIRSLNMNISSCKYRDMDLLEKYSTNQRQRQEFSFHCIFDWNSLPNDVKYISNYQSFKAALYKFFNSKLMITNK